MVAQLFERTEDVVLEERKKEKEKLRREKANAEAEAAKQRKRAEIARSVAEARQREAEATRLQEEAKKREAEAKRLQEEARQRDLCGAKTSAPVAADRVDDVKFQAKASSAEQQTKPTEEEIMFKKLIDMNRGKINLGSRRNKK